MVLRKSGRVDSRRFFRSESESSPWRKPIQFWVGFFRSRQPISHVDVRVFLKQYFCPFLLFFRLLFRGFKQEVSASGMKSCSRPECSFFRDRVFGWQVCPPRRYVWFACNARIVMSQDPAGARIGGDKWSDRSVEKARLGSEFYTGSIEDTRCTTRGLRKAVQWRGLTSLTNGRHIVRKAGIQNPGFRKMHSRSGRVW